MSTSAPLEPQTPGNTPDSEAPIAPNFEESLRRFWEKNSKAIYLACATVFIVVIAKGGYEYFRAQKEDDIAAAYAAASTSDKLKNFAAQYPDHLLGAAATLRLADEAYAAGKYTDAVTSYQKSAAIFKTGPFGARALLGAAISQVLSGKISEGETKLKQLADDTNQPKIIRAEAAYHAGTVAMEASRSDEALKYYDLVSSLDTTGTWSRRAMMHRVSLPAPASPAVSLLPAAKP
jgi:predicted negative regulator of RcsB-dependent stress response